MLKSRFFSSWILLSELNMLFTCVEESSLRAGVFSGLGGVIADASVEK